MLLALLLELRERIAKVQLCLLGTRQEYEIMILPYRCHNRLFVNKTNELYMFYLESWSIASQRNWQTRHVNQLNHRLTYHPGRE